MIAESTCHITKMELADGYVWLYYKIGEQQERLLLPNNLYQEMAGKFPINNSYTIRWQVHGDGKKLDIQLLANS